MSHGTRDRLPIVVVGAGAAGLMAAIHAAGPRRPVLVLEGSRDGGRKIVVSGGGRCNVLPGSLDESLFVTDSSPNTMRKMLRSWPLAEQRRFFEEELGLALRLEEETGKLFPASNRARDVRDALVDAASRRGARFMFSTRVLGVRAGDDAPWTVDTQAGPVEAAAVVVATGGLSVPATGSDGTGLQVARALGHEIHETYPALVPLLAEGGPLRSLAGISLVVSITARSAARTLRRTGGFLVTHRGYSGPSVLDVSHVAVRSMPGGPDARRATPGRSEGTAGEGARLLVQWTPLGDEDWLGELAPRKAGASGVLRTHLPARLADALLDAAGVPPGRSLAELRTAERKALVEALVRFELPWSGHEGYRTAEVTGGGVALGELDPRTMESRRRAGLFFCGEVLDAFGPIGGYNFLWAWATGRAAGLGAAARHP